MSAARAHLRAVPEPLADRTDLERLCAGEVVLLDELDLVAFANSDWLGLERDVPAGDHTAAQWLLAWFHAHVGTDRRTKGDRASGIASDLRRYLLPFFIELTSERPAAESGISHVRPRDVRDLPRVLAGDRQLPAATVAGDLLGRPALTCVWLSLEDAAAVTAGGRAAVLAALADGRLPRHHDRNRTLAIRTADLRTTGLLLDRQVPDSDAPDCSGHGLEPSTARNVLSHLSAAAKAAVNDNAQLTLDYASLRAIEPLPARRKRPKPTRASHVTLATVAAVCAHLHPTAQVAIWMMRLLGMRMGELYGVRLADLLEHDGRLWIRIYRQGGRRAYVRDRRGALTPAETKEHTKTDHSKRVIPMPLLLADLVLRYIEIYHRDPDTGEVDPGARLIVGLQDDDTGGQAGLRSALTKALAEEGLTLHELTEPEDEFSVTEEAEYFHPHDLRAALITHLANEGVPQRNAEMYAGHWSPKTVHQAYDRGLGLQEKVRVVEVLDRALDAWTRPHLRIPTSKKEKFGAGTRLWLRRLHLLCRLRHDGWYVSADPQTVGEGEERGQEESTVFGHAEVAAMIRRAPQTARRLMREGRIQAHQAPWGTRMVWVATREAVQAYLDAQARNHPLTEVATQLGLGYHQARETCLALGLLAEGRRDGAALELSDDAVGRLREEMARRAAAATKVLDLEQAAAELDLPLSTVDNLYRNRTLTPAPSPTGARRRYVTRDSVAELKKTRASGTSVAAGELIVPIDDARRALGIKRPQLTELIQTSQLAAGTAAGSVDTG